MIEAYKILIDDMRDDSGQCNLPRMDLIIRNPRAYDLVKPLLKANAFVLYSDHDLGLTPDSHYERTGYQILMDMFQSGIYPIIVHVITANPVGRKNIEAALRSEGYSVNGIGEWSR
jgi:hypothetical protein